MHPIDICAMYLNVLTGRHDVIKNSSYAFGPGARKKKCIVTLEWIINNRVRSPVTISGNFHTSSAGKREKWLRIQGTFVGTGNAELKICVSCLLDSFCDHHPSSSSVHGAIKETRNCIQMHLLGLNRHVVGRNVPIYCISEKP